ncbi:uncharacterized protein DDB_G0290587-like [Penaeus monodon]|uniref:uncharacterized protein DDB_G0290587-like n=1 Tax=Penaeus monodon TaxID=6687 RepID=UPI0018A7A953|nr:uncharacterized protein DDB_G0290587-like [Penaeus monodon]
MQMQMAEYADILDKSLYGFRSTTAQWIHFDKQEMKRESVKCLYSSGNTITATPAAANTDTIIATTTSAAAAITTTTTTTTNATTSTVAVSTTITSATNTATNSIDFTDASAATPINPTADSAESTTVSPTTRDIAIGVDNTATNEDDEHEEDVVYITGKQM